MVRFRCPSSTHRFSPNLRKEETILLQIFAQFDFNLLTILKVVTLAVYVYFAVSLVGEQWTESEKVKLFALSINLQTQFFLLFIICRRVDWYSLRVFCSLTSTIQSS